MSVIDRVKERILGDKEALQVGREVSALMSEAEDPEAFRMALAEGDLERAIAMTDLSPEEFHARVAKIRAHAEHLAEDYSELAEIESLEE